MPPTFKTRRTRSRPGLAALIGVLALLAQALLPAAALAATAGGAGQAEICTSQGRQIVAVDGHGVPVEPFAGLPCLDCVAATTAAIAPPPPPVAPVVYARPAPVLVPAREDLRRAIRAPPRPPSRAPPAPSA
jgi:hypothetical protein